MVPRTAIIATLLLGLAGPSRAQNCPQFRGPRTTGTVETPGLPTRCLATASYFGSYDFYSFLTGELKRAEPELFALLGESWGKLPERPQPKANP